MNDAAANNVAALPQPGPATAESYLAPASGEPRPLRVRHIRNPEADPAPVLKFPVLALVGGRDGGGSVDTSSVDTCSVDAAPAGAFPPEARSLEAGSPCDSQPSAAAEAATLQKVTAVARAVGQATMEVLAGTRPLAQMARWLDPDSYGRLELRTRLVREAQGRAAPTARRSAAATMLPDGQLRLHRAVTVKSAHVCRLRHDCHEVSLVVVEQHRVRAVALRLELRRGLWKVTALEIG